MDILNAGSLGNYMKTLKLQTQWQLKQKNGDYTDNEKSLDEWLEDSSSSSSLFGIGDDKTSSVDVQAIYLKIQSGKKLTSAEKEYLRANDPEAYEKVKSIERERKSYEREIKRCKTKEEVQRVKMTRLGASLSAVNSIANNPVIPLAKKLEYTMLEHAKTSAIAEVTQKFVKSGAYAKLPTDAEYNEAVREMEEAKEPVLDDQKKDETDVEKTPDTSEQSGEKAEQEIRRAADALRASAEHESPQMRRAKQAKARAAYGNLRQSWESQDEAAGVFVSLDTKG